MSNRNWICNFPYLERGSLQVQLGKMRLYWSRVGLNYRVCSPQRQKRTHTDTEKATKWKWRQHWSDVSMNQETPRIDAQNQKLRERHGTVSFSESPERTNPADIMILDIWPPELWQNKFLLLQATFFVIICHGSPWKLIPASAMWLSMVPHSEVTAVNETAPLPSRSFPSSEGDRQ